MAVNYLSLPATAMAPMFGRQTAPAQDDWGQDDEVLSAPARRAPPIREVVPPRAPLPAPPQQQTPSQAAYDAERLRTERLEQTRLAQQIAQGKAEQDRGGLTGKQFSDLRQQYEGLNAFERTLNELEELNKKAFEGANAGVLGFGSEANVAGYLPSLLRGENQTFNAAGDRLIDQIAQAYGMTGGELNSMAELRARLGPYIPKSTDNDATIRSKLDALRNIFNEQRTILGAQVEDRPAGGEAGLPSGAAPAPGAPPAPPSPPSAPDRIDSSTVPMVDPGQGPPQANTAVRTVENPWVKQHGPRLSAMIVQGAPDEQIRAFVQSTGGNVNVEEALKARRTPEGQRWIREKRYWPVAPTMELRLTPEEREAAEAAISPLGSYLTGAGSTGLSVIEGAASLSGQDEFANDLQIKRDLAQSANPGWSTAGNVAGALTLPGGGVRSLPAVIGVGGGYGALDAFGNTSGTVQERFDNALGGAATGATLAGVLGGAARARAKLRATPPGGDEAVELARAAQEERVPLSRPIVDPSKRAKMGYLESTIGGNQPVQRSLTATREGLESRAADLGGDGTVMTEAGIGSSVQKGAERFMGRSAQIAGRMYDQAEAAAENNFVRARDAVGEIDAQIAELSRNPNSNAPMIKYLEEVRGDFVDEAGELIPKSVGDIRNIRTDLRGNLSTRGLTATDADRRISRVLTAAKKDITRDLGEAAPQAVRLYDRADRFYAQRQKEIGEVIETVLGRNRGDPIAPEKAWANIRAMAGPKGDSETLKRLWAKLDENERADAAATIAENLGRRSADEPFSPALFVSQTRAISPESRALIFGPEGARSIGNLRALSKALTETESALNRSKSGQAINWAQEIRSILTRGGIGGTLGTLAGGPAGGAVGAAIGGGGNILRQGLSARALMNPDMSRWLAAAPRQTTVRAIRDHIGRLDTIAARNPGLANEITGMREGLMRLMTGGAERGARAEEGGDGVPTIQPTP